MFKSLLAGANNTTMPEYYVNLGFERWVEADNETDAIRKAISEVSEKLGPGQDVYCDGTREIKSDDDY